MSAISALFTCLWCRFICFYGCITVARAFDTSSKTDTEIALTLDREETETLKWTCATETYLQISLIIFTSYIIFTGCFSALSYSLYRCVNYYSVFVLFVRMEIISNNNNGCLGINVRRIWSICAFDQIRCAWSISQGLTLILTLTLTLTLLQVRCAIDQIVHNSSNAAQFW